MPKSSKKTSKSNKSPSKSNPSTPLSKASNLHTNPPPTTPRHVDFTLELNDEGHIVDGWSSDDSFEEKITWSRHRMRTTPGGFTPRNIQDVRRRLNLEKLPEDQDSPSLAKPIVLKKRTDIVRPSTPIKTFLAKDPAVLPPTPSPKKTPAVNAQSPLKTRNPVKTPGRMTVSKPAFGVKNGGVARPSSPTRHPVTQVKEFKFASEARSRRKTSPVKPEVNPPRIPIESKPVMSRNSTVDMEMQIDSREDEVEEDEGLAVRMRAREIGKASILAWGETRGRYLDD